jgi:hypothetical protein
VVLVFIYLANPGYFEKIIVHFLKVASLIVKRLDKTYVERDIKCLVSDSVKSLNKYFPVATRGIKVLWVESDTLEGYLDRGFVVVRMKYHKNRPRNIARALVAYIPHILPSEVGAVIEKDLSLAVSCIVATGMAKKEPEIVRQIYEAVDVRFKDSLKGKNLLGKLGEIDDESLFSRILLPEITRACLDAYPKKPIELQDEIMKLVDMLHTLVRGEPLEKPILKGKYINLALVRVAKPEKILLDPELGMHLNFARHCQTRTLYILAAGYNAKLASKLTKRIAKELKFKVDFEDVYKAKYKGSLTDIYCGRLSY